MLLRSILAIGAHPDDVVLGVAGFIARCTDARIRVTMLTLTSGELRGDPLERESEELEAARELNAGALFGRLPDGGLRQRDAIEAIASAVARFEPDLVLAPDANDEHQDHVVTARAAVAATRRVPHLVVYEGPSTTLFRPTLAIDVGSTWTRKRAAFAAYRTQRKTRFLDDWIESTARYRALRQASAHVCEALAIVRADASLFGLPDALPAPSEHGADFSRLS